MTADEITKLAAEVMTSGIKQDGARYVLPETMLIEMVRRIEAAEREACAKVVEADGLARGDEGLVLIKAAGRIRARGEK